MSSIEKISIALPAEMAEMIRDAVAKGEYASNSEIVREALRDWHQKRALQKQAVSRLRRMWQESVADTRDVDPEDVFARLESKYSRMNSTAAR